MRLFNFHASTSTFFIRRKKIIAKQNNSDTVACTIPKLSFRRLKKNDLELVASLPKRYRSIKILREYSVAGLDCFGVFSNSTLIAFVWCNHHEINNGLYKFKLTSSDVFLFDLFVAQRFRRKGVSTWLLHSFEDYAASIGVSNIYDETNIVNWASNKLHSDLGYEKQKLMFCLNIGRRSKCICLRKYATSSSSPHP